MAERCKCGCETNEAGCYCCCNCGQKIYLNKGQTLPPCPRCTNQTFEKEIEDNKDYYNEKSHSYEKEHR